MIAHAASNLAIGLYMAWQGWRVRAPLLHAARHVRETQARVLMDILRANAGTAFGTAHRFTEIASVPVFRERVRVQSYDALAPSIERQQTGERTLTAEAPLRYARTSGTTGRSKDIPVTASGLRQVRLGQQLLAHALWRQTGFLRGAVLGFASPVEEGRLDNGVPYGAASGGNYQAVSLLVRRKFVVPAAVYEIDDAEAKYLAYALATLSRGDITGVVAANPSSILKLVELIGVHGAMLLEALRRGDVRALPEAARMVARQLIARADARHIGVLTQCVREKGRLEPGDIWPNLAAIATWTGGSCGVALARLRTHLPANVRVVEYGYAASEFVGTANVDARANLCLPLLTENFYEFVPRRDWDEGVPRFLGLEELEEGEDYYIFVTTRSGLYRYDINDIVRAGPRIGECPSLRFLQKGRGVTSITGEKLSEHQLIEAVGRISTDLHLACTHYLALADEAAARYRLHLECAEDTDFARVGEAVDRALRGLNSEYDDKRASGRLGPLQAEGLCAGAAESFKRISLARGVREAQYKPVVLDYARDWEERIAPLRLPGGGGA